MAIPGLALGIPSLTPATLVVSLALAFLTLCVGHSVGPHRGIIHRTYEALPVVRGVLAYPFVRRRKVTRDSQRRAERTVAVAQPVMDGESCR
jgi:hypothetical protein